MIGGGLAEEQSHYQIAEIQFIEIAQMYLSPEGFKGFLKGNALKYLLRAAHKGTELKDYQKALQYCKWLCQAQRGEKIDPRELYGETDMHAIGGRKI